jgi:hypothetical protein
MRQSAFHGCVPRKNHIGVPGVSTPGPGLLPEWGHKREEQIR